MLHQNSQPVHKINSAAMRTATQLCGEAQLVAQQRPAHALHGRAPLAAALQPSCSAKGGGARLRPIVAPLSSSNQLRSQAPPPAAVAEALPQDAVTSVDVKGLGFYTGEDGYVYCDDQRVDDIRQQVPESPFYLYSRDRITHSFNAYAQVSAAAAAASSRPTARVLMALACVPRAGSA